MAEQSPEAKLSSMKPDPKHRKNITPDHLQVPKQTNFPERYMSPTDMIISPVSRGLLARNQKNGLGSLNANKTSMGSVLKPNL